MIEPTRGGGGAGSDFGGVGGRAMTLPQSWATAPLGNLCEKLSDGSHNPPKAQETGLPMLSARNINYRKITFDEFRLISPAEFAEEDRRTRVTSGDVLLTIVGAIGRTAVVPQGSPQFTLQRSVAVLKPRSSDPRYISYALEAPALQKYLQDNAKGTAQKGIYLKALAGVEIPIAPEAEQKRIADKLDTVLTRVDAVNTRLARVAPLLKRFRQSVLAAATSGRLTEDWRESNDVAEPWMEVCLGDIADVQGGVTKDSKKQSSADEELPYLRVANVQRGYIDLSEVKTIRVPAHKLDSLLLEAGDILFNEGGDLDKLGRGWVWEGQIERCTYQNHVFRARLHDKAHQPKYVSWWGNYQGLRYFIQSGKQTTNLASINKTMLAALPISMPSPGEQTEIVRRVETLFAFADRLEARLAQAQTAATRLTPALLAKAFRGELVPQDPNDEPAAELLRRLQAERASAPKASAGRGRKAVVQV